MIREGSTAGNLVEVAWEPDAPAASHWRRLYTETTPWESRQAAVGSAAPGYLGSDPAALSAAAQAF